MQFCQHIRREARAEQPFDIGRDYAPTIGNPPCTSQAVLQRRHTRAGLQRITRGDHQPNLIKPKRPHGMACDMDMPDMGRVEGPAQKADATPAAIAETGWSHATRISMLSAKVNWPATSR